MVLLIISGWLICAIASYFLMKQCDLFKCDGVWTIANRTIAIIISLLLGPYNLVGVLFVLGIQSLSKDEYKKPAKW